MATYPLTATPEERAEYRRKRREKKQEVKYLADTMKVTMADIEYALRKFKGNLTKAAEFLGTERTVLLRKIKMTPALLGVRAAIREENLDTAEAKLVELVEQGYFPAVSLMLKTIGQSRGYTERATMEHELSAKGIQDAASLIEAMKRSLTAEELKTIEVKDYAWAYEEEKLLPGS